MEILWKLRTWVSGIQIKLSFMCHLLRILTYWYHLIDPYLWVLGWGWKKHFLERPISKQRVCSVYHSWPGNHILYHVCLAELLQTCSISITFATRQIPASQKNCLNRFPGFIYSTIPLLVLDFLKNFSKHYQVTKLT